MSRFEIVRRNWLLAGVIAVTAARATLKSKWSAL